MKASLGFQPKSDTWDTPHFAYEEISQFLCEDDVVWEPFVGPERRQSEDIWEKLQVRYKATRSDFFQTKMPDACTILVSNPPFSRKFDVIEHLV